ncbi:MFS transporter [Vagococcus acidifermentans]|uniref:Major facilitator superfamily (MFS) profile domain-containing protein n=1 Tax=Vagococcus acidifermentans TaxID=564710 RepID=A0A430ARD6_9ENTE|nr:MFS transporter [Vagococcus acidifermentans]RSU10621.1 hypothetical protein CBF27_09895 [Vagococcus acidifermentans]
MKKKSGLKRNFITIVLLALAGSIIYGLPYFRSYYYDAYVEAYNLTNTQMGSLGSAYGFMGVLSYLIGGILADRFPAKRLIIFSLLTTGIGGFLHLYFTSYLSLLLIYSLWGVTSLLTFWPALMKIVRIQAGDDEQSRAYGLFEGTRGISNILHMAIATAIFGIFESRLVPQLGLDYIIIFYSVIPILCGIAFIFLIKDSNSLTGEHNGEKFSLKNFIKVLKTPAIWLIIGMMFTSYTFNMSIYYFTPYASNVIGTSAVFAAVVTVLAQYCRLFASPIGGFLADKTAKSKVMFIGFVVMAIGTFIMILASSLMGKSQLVLLIIGSAMVYIAMYSNFGLFFSFHSEGGIPINLSGMAIGFTSTLGYLPEVVVPLVAGNILDVFHGNKGYFLYFSLMILMAIIGAVLCIVWWKTYGCKYLDDHEIES